MALLATSVSCSKVEPVVPEPTPEKPVYGRVHLEPSWKPTGYNIIYFNGDPYYIDTLFGDLTAGLWLVNSDGSNMQPFLIEYYDPSYSSSRHPDWSPDGQWVVFSLNNNICKIKSNGDSLVQLTTGVQAAFPSWSQDGSKIAYDVFYSDVNDGLWVMDNDGGNKSKFTTVGRDPDWSSDNLNIICSSFDYSYTGPGFRTFIYKVNVITGDTIRLTTINGDVRHLEYSNDGNKIAYDYMTPERLPVICVMNSDGTNQTSLMTGSDLFVECGETPTWSPDGTKIVYTNCCAKYGKLWIMNSDGTNKQQLTN